MAQVNSKNSALFINTAGTGAWTRVTKTHGLKLGLSKDWADASSHGDTTKSYTGGLMDFSATVMQWYESTFWLLDGASFNGASYYFLAYHNYPSDTTNYWRGQCTFGFNEDNMDLNNTIDRTFDMRIYNGDVQLVRNATVYG